MHFEPSKPGEIVPVPSVLFGPLLERISSLGGLRCALRIIFLLHRKQGKLKYVSTAELVADPVLQWGDGTEAAEQILETFVKFGLLVRVPGGGKNSGCYCLDNMANRRAIARVGKGELPGPETKRTIVEVFVKGTEPQKNGSRSRQIAPIPTGTVGNEAPTQIDPYGIY